MRKFIFGLLLGLLAAGLTTASATVIVTQPEPWAELFFAVKRTDITTSSVNIPFNLGGRNARKVAIEVPATNTDEICVDWIGQTALCPPANTPGDDRITPGTAVLFDDFHPSSISVIAASGTQTIFVRAWR